MRGIARITRATLSPIFSASLKQKTIDEILRVDHAGEVAAVRIAARQLDWMSPLNDAVPIVREILSDELVHAKVMDDLAKQHGVRKTILDPLFNVGAFVIAVGTTMLGKEAMMCCHAAVEVTIFDHYNNQLREMEVIESACGDIKQTEDTEAWRSLKDIIMKFRDEEKHHQELGEKNGADRAPVYPLLYNGIRLACKLGIGLAQKL